MSLIVTKAGQPAVRVEPSSFDNEDHVQTYIQNNPECIPLHEIKENGRVVILAREFPTISGPIDGIGIDADGDVYAIETKLYKNPDKRFVVSQVLDYGAALWSSGYEFSEFMRIMDEKCEKKFNMTAREKLKQHFNITDEETDDLLDRVRTNLLNGRFKFVVLMDKLHERLKNLILFLNKNCTFDVYAVELEYYKHDKQEIVIPRLYGAETKKDIHVPGEGRSSRAWDEAAFLDHAKQNLPPEELGILERLVRHFAEHFDTRYGKGGTRGSFIVTCPYKGEPLSLFRITSTGIISFYTTTLKERGVPSEDIRALGRDLAAVHPDFKVSDPTKKYLQASIAALANKGSFDVFIKTVQQWVEYLQK